MRDFVAIVPARAGSKGRPGKNIADLAGKPLWRWSVDQALEAGAAQVIVTTDIADILKAPAEQRVTVIERPADLATDTTPMAPVLLHALSDEALSRKTIVLLQPTSPLRIAKDITDAIAVFGHGRHDLVMSVTEADRGVLKYGTLGDDAFEPLRDPAHCFSNRQSLPPVYRPTGAVYVFNRDWFLANGGFATDRIGAVQMPAERALDVDTQEDLSRAAVQLWGRED